MTEQSSCKCRGYGCLSCKPELASMSAAELVKFDIARTEAWADPQRTENLKAVLSALQGQ